MADVLTINDMENIMIGATFLGAGGGGSSSEGKGLLKHLEEMDNKIEVKLINPEEMEEGKYATMVACIGAPRDFKDKSVGEESINAFKALSKASYIGGKPIKYLMPGELGGFNTIVPLYVAAIKGIPFLNADGNGRAVPELSTGLYPAYDIPARPLAVSNNKGDSVIGYLDNSKNHNGAEVIARQMSIGWSDMGEITAFSTWVVDQNQVTNCLAPNSITKCKKVGKIFNENKKQEKSIDELSKNLNKEIDAIELFRGTVKKLDTNIDSGFDVGSIELEGFDKYKGENMSIQFKNENILAEIDGKVVAMVPDLISYFDSVEKEPLTNAEIEEGKKLVIYGSDAPDNWKENDEGINCWKPILDDFGYEGDYIPLK